MSTREWLAILVGTIGGGFLSAGCFSLMEPTASLWLAAISGAIFGFFAGLRGETIFEGCYTAGILLVLFTLVAVGFRNKPVRLIGLQEILFGAFIGSVVGSIASRILQGQTQYSEINPNQKEEGGQ